MKRRLLATFGLLFASAAVAGGGWRALLSPGPLGRGHEEHAGDCDQCHLVYEGVPNSLCLDCHTELAARMRAGRGFHATAGGECVDCHVDHRGADASLTTDAALAAFDHTRAGFSLDGAHGDVACETCHDAPLGRMESVCIECHSDTDPHQSELGPECDACHRPTAWNQGIKSIGAHLTAMGGGHAPLDCADCHRLGAHLEPAVACAECHAEAHDGTTAACDRCHTVEAFKPAEFDHGPCTCSFAGVHQTAACVDCHPAFDFTDTPVHCAGCHDDERTHEPLGACSKCHEATSWSENTFDHTRATFALEGEHLNVDCAGCHTMQGAFRGLAHDCASCHRERGDTAHGDFGACSDCHDTAGDGFQPAHFDHAARAGFGLTGRHEGLACRDCHPSKVEGYPR
jgi:hypothetical protein